MKRLLEIRPQPGFKLFLRYEDGASGEVDLSDLAGKGVFSAWLEAGIFEQATITEGGGVEWPGEIDLCPDALYMRLTGKSPEEVLPTLWRSSANA